MPILVAMTVHFPFQNTYAALPANFFARVAPTPVASPRLIKLNRPLALHLGLDLGRARHRSRGRPPGRVTDPGGEVADDQDDLVPGVLEFAQLRQHDRVAEVDVGGGRVDPQLHAQRSGPGELLGEHPLGQHVDGVTRQVRHRPNARLRASLDGSRHPFGRFFLT